MPVELRNYGAEGIDTGAQTMSQNIRDANAGTRNRQELANYIKQTALQNTVQLAQNMLELGTQKIRSIGPNGETIEQTVITDPELFNSVNSLYKGLQQGITSHVKDKNGKYIPTIDPRAGSHFMLDPDNVKQSETANNKKDDKQKQETKPSGEPYGPPPPPPEPYGPPVFPGPLKPSQVYSPTPYHDASFLTGIQLPQRQPNPNSSLRPPYAPQPNPASQPNPVPQPNFVQQPNPNAQPFQPLGWLTNAQGFLNMLQNLNATPNKP
ncbi:MAG: hypothetical protein WHV28_08850 [Bacteroidota bacterium]